MKFGFDIDDTLINLREYAFHIYNKKLNQKVSLSDFHALTRVEIHEPFGLSDEEGKEMWNRTLEDIYYTNCPAFPDAVETLIRLAVEGHDIYYITSRPKEHGERTKEWMKEQGFPVRDNCFFYGMQDDEKVRIIQELQLDYYFDDKPAVLYTISSDSVKAIVKDQSYNRDIRLPRLINWSDLESIL